MKARLIKRFEAEITALERELQHDLPKEIQRARELGDLRENAEYAAAKERQRFVEARVSMLRTRVSQIQLMNLDRIPHDKAGFGSKLTLREQDRTFVYELVMPEDGGPHPAKFMDVNMLAMTEGGCERTERQYADLLQKAGLRLVKIHPTPSPVSIVEAAHE